MPEWRNWSGDQRCRPAQIVRPRDRDELQAAIAALHAEAETAIAEVHGSATIAPTGKRIIVKEGAGCIRCRNTGYYGRTGIFEILPVDNAIRDLIERGDVLRCREAAGGLDLDDAHDALVHDACQILVSQCAHAPTARPERDAARPVRREAQRR